MRETSYAALYASDAIPHFTNASAKFSIFCVSSLFAISITPHITSSHYKRPYKHKSPRPALLIYETTGWTGHFHFFCSTLFFSCNLVTCNKKEEKSRKINNLASLQASLQGFPQSTCNATKRITINYNKLLINYNQYIDYKIILTVVIVKD